MSASERAVILWDFDGTLAFRAGMWSGCLIETLDRHEPGHGVSADALKPALRDGFPWHRPETPHPELCAPGAWWLAVEPLLARAYESVGYAPARSAELASFARQRFIDWTVGWELFADAVPVLERLTEQGWRHVILSNHVPELAQLVAGLGLTDLVDAVITSAATGYEKPHADAFARRAPCLRRSGTGVDGRRQPRSRRRGCRGRRHSGQSSSAAMELAAPVTFETSTTRRG